MLRFPPLLFLISTVIAPSDREKTHNVVHVAGVPSVITRRAGDTTSIRGDGAYVVYGTVSLVLRPGLPATAVSLSLRGSSDALLVSSDSSDACRFDDTAATSVAVLARARGIAAQSACGNRGRRIGRWLQNTSSDARGALLTLSLGQGDTAVVDYLAVFRTAASVERNIDVVIAALDAEPLSISSRLVVLMPPVSTALLPGVLPTLIGALLGFVLTYAGFRAQQGFLIRRDAERAFITSRTSRAAELARIFRDYVPIRRAPGPASDTLQNVRRFLIDEGLYSMLPIEDVLRIDAQSKKKNPLDGLQEVDALLTRRFGDFTT
jgi:hypothetical protein